MNKKRRGGKYVAYALVFCMLLGGYIYAMGMDGLATSADQTEIQAIPAGLTGIQETATSLVSMPATSTDLKVMPATATDLRGLPATATDLRELPATTTDLRGLPATSTDLKVMPATSTDLKWLPATSTDLMSMPATATDLTGIPTIHSDPSAGAGPMTASSLAEGDAINEALIDQDYTELKDGQIIRMGYYEQDGNLENFREPIEWKVISINKKKHVALVVSVYALESMPYGTAGDEEEYTKPEINWKSSGIRGWLNGEFYEKTFTEAEKKRIRRASNVTKDPSGRFTTKDYVFLLSQIEARRYFGTAEKLKCEATPYVMEKLGSDSAAIAKDGYCLWWVREMARAVKTNRQGQVVRNSRNEAGYIYGGRGLRMFLRKTGAKTYEENAALVRPAMWIKFDPAPKK